MNNPIKQQAIRLYNTVLAALGGLVLVLIFSYCYMEGNLLVSRGVFGWAITFFSCVTLAFVVIVKLGINLKFNEPSLTLPQMLWAASCSLLALGVSRELDGAYYLLVLITMVFGVFRCQLKAFYYYCTFVIILALVVVLVRSAVFDAPSDLMAALLLWLTFSFCALAVLMLCRSMVVLRNRLRDKNNALEEALQARSYFLANMSHEIRTPMNGVLGMLDVVLRSELDAEHKRFLTIAQSSAKGLLVIINDILDFSKIEAGKLNIEVIDFDVHEFVQEITQIFTAKAKEKNVEFILDIPMDLQRVIQGDPVRIRQVLNNLLSNAFKFIERGEIILRLRVNVHCGSQVLEWSVEDTGIGIEQQQQYQLFEPFTQADASTTRLYGGTGLGLAICKELVELMGGVLQVKSELGRGSCFSFDIPFTVQPAHDLELCKKLELTDIHILIVDANISICDVLSNWLRTLGATTVSFHAPETALAYSKNASHGAFDIVLIDQQMPNIDALAMVKGLRALPQLNPFKVIILNSHDDDISIKTRNDLDISASIHKPLLPLNVGNIITQVVQASDLKPCLTTVPTRQDESVNTRAPVTAKFSLKGYRVLLVDDNEVNRVVAGELLTDLGVEVSYAVNGKEAIDLLEEKSQEGYLFSLVMMDCQMPILDGYAATQLIRGHTVDAIKALPVIAMTANAMEGDKDKCLKSGMNDYISKPIDLERVNNVLELWLHTHCSRIGGFAVNKAKSVKVSSVNKSELQGAEVALDWDEERLLKLVNNKPQRMKKLLISYLDQLDQSVAGIQTKLSTHQVEQALMDIHGLKGASANLGAMRLAAYLAKTEHGIKNGDVDCDAWHDDMKCIVNSLKALMNDYLVGVD